MSDKIGSDRPWLTQKSFSSATASAVTLGCNTTAWIPFYFWFVTGAKNFLQITFLCASFIVFAISIASKELLAALTQMNPTLGKIGPVLNGAAIVLPILWAFLIARIFATAFKKRLVASRRD